MSKGAKYESAPHRHSVLMLVGIAGGVTSILPFVGTLSAAEMHSHASVIKSRVAAKQRELGDKVCETAAVLRDLLVDHVFWVRNVSIATFNKNNAAMKTADKRVVANAQLIADHRAFYRIAAQEHLFKLLEGSLRCSIGLSRRYNKRRCFR